MVEVKNGVLHNSNRNVGRVGNLYKVRKYGNSSIVTIPAEVKVLLQLNDGDIIEFNVSESGNIVIEKAVPKVDVDQSIQKTIEQYEGMLKKLVQM